MDLVRRLLLTMLVACGPSPKGPIATRATQPTTVRPAPKIEWETDADTPFQVHGLPAVTHDGRTVVVNEEDPQRLYGDPSLILQMIDVADRRTGSYVVATAKEAQDWLGNADTVSRDLRIAAGNRWLAELHERTRLRPMVTMEPRYDDERDDVRYQDGRGTSLEWYDGHLTITRDRKRIVDRPTPEEWQGSLLTACLGSYAQLEGAAVDLDEAVAVVWIAVSSECAEPPARAHVISW